MPFVQTMPIMRLGHCVPKVKLPSCQFPLYAYLALSMAFFGFKICFDKVWEEPTASKAVMWQRGSGTVGAVAIDRWTHVLSTPIPEFFHFFYHTF